MKLGYCPVCKDFFRLTRNVRSCSCGKSSGVMKNNVLATVSGLLRVVGIKDNSFFKSLYKNAQHGSGIPFEAYLLPKHNKNVVRIEPSEGVLDFAVSADTKPLISPYGILPPKKTISAEEGE
jgi:hypothetical protein